MSSQSSGARVTPRIHACKRRKKLFLRHITQPASFFTIQSLVICSTPGAPAALSGPAEPSSKSDGSAGGRAPARGQRPRGAAGGVAEKPLASGWASSPWRARRALGLRGLSTFKQAPIHALREVLTETHRALRALRRCSAPRAKLAEAALARGRFVPKNLYFYSMDRLWGHLYLVGLLTEWNDCYRCV